MGHDLNVIANHRIDMSSAKNLALDLSERLNAGIEFSFCFWNEEIENHFWEPQFTINESKPKRYSMMLDFVNMTDFDPNFYFEKTDNWSELNISKTEDYDSHNFELWVHKMEIDRPRWNWGRWWGFVQFVLGDPYPNGQDAIRDFRLGVREEVRRYGGDTVLYFSDQGSWQGLSYDSDHEQSFEDLLEKLKREEKNLWHLPSLLARPPLKFSEVNRSDYPIFWDDFADLQR